MNKFEEVLKNVSEREQSLTSLRGAKNSGFLSLDVATLETTEGQTTTFKDVEFIGKVLIVDSFRLLKANINSLQIKNAVVTNEVELTSNGEVPVNCYRTAYQFKNDAGLLGHCIIHRGGYKPTIIGEVVTIQLSIDTYKDNDFVKNFVSKQNENSTVVEQPENIDLLNKSQLIAFADAKGIEVDRNATKSVILAAIKEEL